MSTLKVKCDTCAADKNVLGCPECMKLARHIIAYYRFGIAIGKAIGEFEIDLDGDGIEFKEQPDPGSVDNA